MPRKYIVIQDYIFTTFISKVNEAIQEGYVPLGGISTLITGHSEYTGHYEYNYFQAMIKE